MPEKDSEAMFETISTTETLSSNERRELLPPPPAHCVGRDDQLEDLVGALLLKNPEPLAILGDLGVGKSHLTLSALYDERVVQRYDKRLFFVRCDVATTAEALLSELARTLGIEGNALLPAILDHLQAVPAVVALDNAETLLEQDDEQEQIEQVVARLAKCPGVALIASLRGRRTIPGLAWRKPSILLSRLEPPSSRELFLRIAGPDLAEDNQLQTILGVCDGLPLAIELLARRAEGSPDLGGLWQEWKTKRTEVLKRGDGKGKRKSLDVSFELSLGSARMTAEAKKLLSLLSQLPDGLAVVDLQQVMPENGLAARDVLLKLGLAFAEPEIKRVRMLAPIRESALRRCQPEGAQLTRLDAHYLKLVQRLVPNIGRFGGREAMARLALEVSNIERCLARRLKEGQDVAFEISLQWGEFLRFSHLGTLRPLEQALKIAKKQKDIHLQGRLNEQLGKIAQLRPEYTNPENYFRRGLIAFSKSADIRGQATCLQGLGQCLLLESRHTTSQNHYEKALTYFIRLQNTKGQADCLKGLGDLLIAKSDQDRAEQCYERAIQLYNEDKNLLEQANCFHRLGDIQQRKSQFAKAREFYETSKNLFEQIGPIPGNGRCLLSLGDLLLTTADPQGAREHYKQASVLFEQFGTLDGKAECLLRLGHLHRHAAESEPAIQCYQQARMLFQQLDQSLGQANCLLGLGITALDTDNLEDTIYHLGDARRLFGKVGDLTGQARCLQQLGDVFMRQNDQENARKSFQQGLKAYTDIGSIIGQAHCLIRLGEVRKAQGRISRAQEHFHRALSLYFSLDDRESMAKTYPHLARIAESDAERRMFLRAARSIWEELGKPEKIKALTDEFEAADIFA